jgi:hypothetical protein
LSENSAKHIFIEIFLVISSIHPTNFNYICSENIFIDLLGNILMQDTYITNINFDTDEFVYRYPDYVAPEEIKGLGKII